MFIISLFAVVMLYLYTWKSIIAIILYVLILLIQVLFYIPVIMRHKKIRAHEKKYGGEVYTNDPAIIDQLSELYLKESKTLISLLYQFFYGIR
jgi:ABC-type transport system involved in cytochrome bd biosynthesis fused ATPase/permease subunit